MRQIPVVDLFAGPGGLSEGFHAYSAADLGFSVRASIEKEEYAYNTLLLRSFFREFPRGAAPEAYYEYVSGLGMSRDELFARFPDQAARATQKAHLLELGASTEARALTDQIVERAIGGAADWVLLGGPPCQAYSVAGRARHAKVERAVFEADQRHLLYREYLRILARFRPAVFVMENVKGLATAKLGGESVFRRILEDLEAPAEAMDLTESAASDIRYHICSFVVRRPDARLLRAQDFVIEADRYGMPQKRERIILLGIRADIAAEPFSALEPEKPPTVGDVISDLPPLRSCLSREPDSPEAWNRHVLQGAESVLTMEQVRTWPKLREQLEKVIRELPFGRPTGGRFMQGEPRLRRLSEWYADPRLRGFLNHEARSHMPSDLARYLFVSCFGAVFGQSPSLHDFPPELYPDHQNVGEALKRGSGGFVDRFKVQLRDQPASTIVSHMAKDGHYYIHFDPLQCRSLTVREAARLQTFPDNYFFEGNRTEQYTQVGNAVPPLLANKLARIVAELLGTKASAGTQPADIAGLDAAAP